MCSRHDDPSQHDIVPEDDASDETLVWVRPTVADRPEYHGAIAIGHGVIEGNRPVTFYAEPRLIRDAYRAAMDEGDPVAVSVPSWALR